MAEMKLKPLEFDIFRRLHRYSHTRWLVAVSGGHDSMALLQLLLNLRSRLSVTIAVAHIHHGPTSQGQLRARDEARNLVRKVCSNEGLEFFEAPASIELPKSQSEAELRRYRHEALEHIRSENGFDFIVFAHHSDDLFETRLLRLIRGTGPEGMQAMRIRMGKKLRPLLGTSRDELRRYFTESGLSATVDPSNEESGPLRNWLRHVWLKELDLKRPGSSKALQRSLALLAETLANRPNAPAPVLEALSQNGLDRRVFDSLGAREKKMALALYLRRLNATNFSKSQIEEVIKRLDTYQKRLAFKIGPLNWSINAEQIQAEHHA